MFGDTTTLKKVCKDFNINYLISLRILELMVKNKFLSISLADKECENCGLLIYTKNKKAFVIKSNSSCKSLVDCYWNLTLNKKVKKVYKIKTTSVTQDILLLSIKRTRL